MSDFWPDRDENKQRHWHYVEQNQGSVSDYQAKCNNKYESIERKPSPVEQTYKIYNGLNQNIQDRVKDVDLERTAPEQMWNYAKNAERDLNKSSHR